MIKQPRVNTCSSGRFQDPHLVIQAPTVLNDLCACHVDYQVFYYLLWLIWHLHDPDLKLISSLDYWVEKTLKFHFPNSVSINSLNGHPLALGVPLILARFVGVWMDGRDGGRKDGESNQYLINIWEIWSAFQFELSLHISYLVAALHLQTTGCLLEHNGLDFPEIVLTFLPLPFF